MSDKVRLGIIGCGVIGKEHLKGALKSPDAEVVAVADVRVEAAQAVAAEFNVPNVVESGDKLATSGLVDAVVLALPTGVRAPVAVAALKAGKHVLLEKPAAMNAQELKEMAAVRGDRVVACASSRFSAYESAKTAAKAVAEGAIGNVRVIRFRGIGAASKPKTPPPAWRLNRKLNGGGIFVNWSTYDLDYVLAAVGWRVKPKWALASSWRVSPPIADWVAPDSDAETHVAGTITCEDGIVIHFERGELIPAAAESAWQIVGDRGTLQLHLPGAEDKKIVLNKFGAEGVESETIWQGREVGGVHEGPVRDFLAAIREGRRPLTGFDEALLMQRLIDAVYRSADTGGPVTVE